VGGEIRDVYNISAPITIDLNGTWHLPAWSIMPWNMAGVKPLGFPVL
jgi:hypothetical protein